MIDDLKPYPEYKESGLPWLGRVPGHWSLERTKWRFRHRKELNTSGAHTNILSLTLRGVVNNDPNDPEGLVPKDYRTYQFFAKGNLVFKLIDLENLRTSRVGLVHEDGIMSSAYVRLAPSGPTNIRYFFHQFYDLYTRGIYNQLGAGVRSTLGPSDLLNVGIVIPPPDEQAAIVRFLDWTNGRLERAIRAKRKVIALLNEQKQAIIHRAVTRGLDPSAPLKPSGIPWLGDIPQHWEVRPLKQLLTRMDYGTSQNVRGEGRVRVLTMGHIRDGKVLLPGKGGLDAVPRGLLLEKNDLLFNRTNSPELVGKVGLFTGDAEDEVTFASYLVRLRACSLHSPLWLNYLLNSTAFWSYARSQALVSLHQANLNSKRYGQMLLPVTSKRAEQDKMVEHIRSRTGAIERAISRLEREIELLREYRTRLVADVVTGKLDVREAAARLPEEDAPDPVEDNDVSDETEPADDEAAA